MMSKALFATGCCVALSMVLFGDCSGAVDQLTPKAIVIMLDGMRADTIDNGLAPNIKSLADGKWQPGYQGAWSLGANTLRDGTTESAPNHVAIATGKTVKKTGSDLRSK